jgi:Tfp pilus assembly protein PilN
MRLLPSLSLSYPVAAAFAPSERFFVRVVPLAPDTPIVSQAELALEALAPFPPAQLYWGCCPSPDRAQALLYAAHRRRFTAEETAAWAPADLVVPRLLALAGAANATSPGLLVLAGENGLDGVAWTAGANWPTAVHTRGYTAAPTEHERNQFIAELAAKAGLSPALARIVSGTPRARREGDRLVFELVDASETVLNATAAIVADQDTLDLRDRTFLDQRRKQRRQSEFIWRTLLAGCAVLALAAVLDLGALGFHWLARAVQSRSAAQASVVQRLESANTLINRVEELTRRRLKFFEMLASINEPRPRSIQFTRTGTSGPNVLEIEAQTGNADDIGAYEAALRALAVLQQVEVHDLRTREGVTSFALTATFKTETAAGAGTGGAP